MGSLKIVLPILLLFALSSCATTMYTWDKYDSKLYKHYKNPADNERFIEALKESIVDGEQSGKIPPGLYAEYGYVLYEKGDYSEASEYFTKEYDKWPESRPFMSKMIGNAKKMENRRKTNE